MIGARVKVADGWKSLHVVLPLQNVYMWDEVNTFTKRSADHLVLLIPDR